MARRDYDNDFPSVTTILGVLRKIGLENWFKVTPLKQIQEESDKGKLIGTQIHDVIHAYIQNEKAQVSTAYAEEVTNALNSFMLFRKENPDIKLINSEMPLTSNQFKFNGTLDCLAETKGLSIIGDWKTGRAKEKDKPDIYDEYLYQVAAYVNLYNEINKTDIKEAVIIALAKDKVAYNLYRMNAEEVDICFNEVFLSALKIYNNQRIIAKMRKEK